MVDAAIDVACSDASVTQALFDEIGPAVIALFLRTWPTFNTLAALGVNIAMLVALLWLHWPPQAMVGT